MSSSRQDPAAMTGRTNDAFLLHTTGSLELADGEVFALPTTLSYGWWDCLAVTMTLHSPAGADVAWTFDWEMLRAGLSRSVGVGEVHIAPLVAPRGTIRITLVVPGSATRIRLPAGDVRWFVDQAAAMAPLHAGWIGATLDDEIAAIMEAS